MTAPHGYIETDSDSVKEQIDREYHDADILTLATAVTHGRERQCITQDQYDIDLDQTAERLNEMIREVFS